MTATHLPSDRMPDVARGALRWSPEESAHLAHCAECRLEWDIVRSALVLGSAHARLVDTDRAAAGVLRRLAAAPSEQPPLLSRPMRWLTGLAAAAAVVLALVPGANPNSAVPPAIAVLHELDGLTSSELEAVLETIPPPANAAVHVEASPLGELNAHDLERVLQSME